MSRLEEWLKNLLNVFGFHTGELPPAVVEKEAAPEKKKEGGGHGDSGGLKMKNPVADTKPETKAPAPSPFKDMGGGGF